MGNTAAGLRPEALSDLEETTNLTSEEICSYYKEFMKDCPSGRMSMPLEDFKAAYAKVFPHGDANKFATHVFNHFDQDGSGRIDFREFLQAISVQLKGTTEQRLTFAFDLYDLDGTGFIEKSELLEMISSQYRLKSNTLPAEEQASPQQMVDYVMAKADVNNDGKLSRQEFVNGALESKTILKLMLGTLQATRSPFT